MKQALKTALWGGVWGAAAVWALLLFVAVFIERPRELEDIFVGFFVSACTGGVLGFGIGLAMGSARASFDGDRPRRFAARGKRSFSEDTSAERPGLSGLDFGVAVAYGLALTALSLIPLLIVFGGPRRLVRVVMEVAPFASLGRQHALLMIVGTLQLALTLPWLVSFSRRPPQRSLEWAHVRGVTASGFVSGLVWPGLLLALLVG